MLACPVMMISPTRNAIAKHRHRRTPEASNLIGYRLSGSGTTPLERAAGLWHGDESSDAAQAHKPRSTERSRSCLA
jgi:hypothetical protein